MATIEECKKCRGTGWILVSDGELERASMCPDCRRRSRSSRRRRSAAIPPRYAEQVFESFSFFRDDDSLKRKALERAIHFANSYPNVKRGLLFVGPCGVGKTHLSVSILNAILARHDTSARFVDETDLLRNLQYSYGPDSQATEENLLRPLRHSELLVWDDLGTGRPTEWVRETIHTIINYRYTNERLTIFSSNLKLPDNPREESLAREPTLSDRIGERLYSRILEMCEIVKIRGKDFRKEVLKTGQDFQRTHRG
jgi:DNA replication protein DnaC